MIVYILLQFNIFVYYERDSQVQFNVKQVYVNNLKKNTLDKEIALHTLHIFTILEIFQLFSLIFFFGGGSIFLELTQSRRKKKSIKTVYVI
jgi:hypothetical protein